jgi:hypothetical protein
MPLNQYNYLVKQLDSRKKYLKNQGLLWLNYQLIME